MQTTVYLTILQMTERKIADDTRRSVPVIMHVHRGRWFQPEVTEEKNIQFLEVGAQLFGLWFEIARRVPTFYGKFYGRMEIQIPRENLTHITHVILIIFTWKKILDILE